MKISPRNPKFAILFLSAVMAFSVIAGCGKKNKMSSSAPQSQTNGQTKETSLSPEDNFSSDSQVNGLSFRPSELGIPAKEKYEYPYMGMEASLTGIIRSKMDSRDVILFNKDEYAADDSLKYAVMYWYTLTEEQKNETTTAFDPDAWRAGLGKLGTLGVYRSDCISDLDTLTGCSEHKEIGKSADGNYSYYMSFSDNADKALRKELEKTEIKLTEMKKTNLSTGDTAFSEGSPDTTNVGSFKTTDINGQEYTEEIFKAYDLTLVNVFATWCSPCISEMPELEALKKAMEEKGIPVNVIGIVYDTVTETGEKDAGAIEAAKVLQKKANLTFPLLIPDETDMNGRLKGINSFPESFFVDGDGNLVGNPYLGTRSLEQWMEISEEEFANLKEIKE